MDILGEYEKQHPAARVLTRPASFRPDSEYGFFIKLVMRLSGGKIENAHQASFVLLIVAASILLISLFVFARTNGWFSSQSSNLQIPVAGPGDERFNNPQKP